MTKMVYSALEKNKKCATICLDLAKDFDTVNHDKLLYKMQKKGYRRVLISPSEAQ